MPTNSDFESKLRTFTAKGQEQGKSLRTPAFALKGRNEIAQGNALGKWHTKTLSPQRAKGAVKWLLRPFRAFLMGDLVPGVALRFHPGLSLFRPFGT